MCRRLKWMIYATVGPGFTLGAAARQYESARNAVQEFMRIGHPEWTMRHAFFADMGSFMLHASDCPTTDFPTFEVSDNTY